MLRQANCGDAGALGIVGGEAGHAWSLSMLEGVEFEKKGGF